MLQARSACGLNSPGIWVEVIGHMFYEQWSWRENKLLKLHGFQSLLHSFSYILVSTKNFRLQQGHTYLSSLKWCSRSSNQPCWWWQAQEAILTLSPQSHHDTQESSKQNYYFKRILWTQISTPLTATDPSHNWRLAKRRFTDRYITKSEKFCFFYMLMC